MRRAYLPLLSLAACLPALAFAQSGPPLPGQTPPASSISQEEVVNFFSNNVDVNAPLQSSAPALATTEKSKDDIEAEIRKEAFDAAVESLLPLKPNEIRELLEQFDRTQESVELPVYPSPKPEVTVQTVPLDPGTKPAVIKVAYGHVSTLNILDLTGSPWPIEDISWAGNFEITNSGASEGTHIVRISPQSEFAYGNMSIKLLTLKTPVILTMETSRDLVHYRFDAVIPDNGPLAETPLIQSGITLAAGGNPDMSSVLQGVGPAGSERLDVSGVDSRTSAYRVGNETYVRTPLTLLSPSWSSSVASADGMRVYTVRNAPVLLLSDNGKMVRAHLSTREDTFDE